MADEDKPAMFRLNEKEYPLVTSPTLGEMCDAEYHFKVEFGENATSGIRMAAAMLWISIKRVDPTVTPDDIRALDPSVFEAFGDVSPPESLQESGDGESGSSSASGDSSSNGGGDPDVIPEPIGTPS